MTAPAERASRVRRARARSRWGRRALAAALGLAVGAAGAETGSPAAGQAPEPAPAGAPAASSGRVGLDRLLTLPSGAGYDAAERRGGATRAQWAVRFASLREALAAEKLALEAAQRERDRVAGSVDQWLLGPPGTTGENVPLDFRLRREVASRREEVERLEKEIKRLEVEANLADVPPQWRE